MLIAVRIEGQTPLLMNRFTEAAQAKVATGTSTAITSGTRGLPREQAAPKVYLNDAGKPIVPGPNVAACIVAAGEHVKAGRSKLSTKKSSLIPAGITLLEPELPITPAAWEVDSRSVVIPATGGRVMCHRPRFDKWALGFTLDVDETMFSEQLVRELVDLAGKRIGLGDFRPARRGPFGRFAVVSWKKT